MQRPPWAHRHQWTGRYTSICPFPHPCPIPLLLSAGWEACGSGVSLTGRHQGVHCSVEVLMLQTAVGHWNTLKKLLGCVRTSLTLKMLSSTQGSGDDSSSAAPEAVGQSCKWETHTLSSCLECLQQSFYCSMYANGSGLGRAGCEGLLWSFLLPISTILSKHHIEPI